MSVCLSVCMYVCMYVYVCVLTRVAQVITAARGDL